MGVKREKRRGADSEAWRTSRYEDEVEERKPPMGMISK